MYSKPLNLAGLAVVLAMIFPIACMAGTESASAAGKVPDNLQLVEKDRYSSLYADPSVDWASYREIQLLEAPVSFRRNWQRDQNQSYPFKVKDEDMEEIKQSLADLLDEVLTEELTLNGGYSMSPDGGAQVLTLKPAIVELDIAAPDTMVAGMNRQYTDSNGRMTLQLELVDSISGKVLAKASDRYEDPRRDWYEWTNTVTNQAEARRLFKRWAADVRERLNEGSFTASANQSAAD